MNIGDLEPFDAAVHQAEGALAAVLGVSAEHAAMILRVRADRRGLPLCCVADEVLARQMSTPVDPNISGSC
ncbi:hypothetical protein [Actinomycetospora chibensis]|uniref:ANTAR domain-containing protein n=1 Tax=Actinomycetospora chibensis TaxID=663606 RepID=A0ABV9RJ17_9PSEU|nr:hypothetical protein [Actinomycetospora chibensis]MDD7926233.1 hypothetical protein [Actinomycetospora chibensis]